jgi:hypothetical protein
VALDWEPLPRPKPEHVEEFAVLFDRLQSGYDAGLVDRLHAISIPVFETLGAPRIGYDEAADDWLRARGNADDFYDALMKMHGYYVVELLPACDGFPVYTKYTGWPHLARYAFRGSALDDARPELGPLYYEAARYLSKEQLEDFGERLTACARRVARKHRIMELELVKEPRYAARSIEGRVHVIFAAARWCLYWARRGHGLAPSH